MPSQQTMRILAVLRNYLALVLAAVGGAAWGIESATRPGTYTVLSGWIGMHILEIGAAAVVVAALLLRNPRKGDFE